MNRKSIYMSLLCYFAFSVWTKVHGQQATNVFPSSGRVGIGTTAPLAQLHVNGDVMIPEGNAIMVRGGDPHHQLTYCLRLGNNEIDGPALFGWNGGILGSIKSNVASAALRWDGRGYVGIGTNNPTEMLSVNGNIRAHQVKVETANWPDYVFKDDYQLTSLKDTEKFIQLHGHLPEVPKAEIVEKEGYSLNEMDKILLKKIEELTLHLIAKDKRIEDQQKELNSLKERLDRIK